MENLRIIHTLSDISRVSEYVSDKSFIAYDCETTGITSRDEVVGVSISADENTAYYIVLAKWNTETKRLDHIPGMKDAVRTLLEQIKTKNLIMHNSVFDCMMAEAFFKIRLIDSIHTDTMILAHLLDENRRVGLKELSKTYFGADSTQESADMKASVLDNGGVWAAKNKEMYKADSALLAKYGAKDALLTYKLFLKLVPELYEQNLDKFFYEDESMPLLRGATYEMNTIGLQVDRDRLMKLKKTLEAECAEAKAFVQSEIQSLVKDKYPGDTKNNAFNIGSPSQLAWLLFGHMALEFNSLSKEGKNACKALGLKLPYTYSAQREFISTCTAAKGLVYNGKKKFKDPWSYIAVDKKTLSKLAPKYEWIAKLLEYKKKMKLLTTYVEGIENRLHYGIIQPSFVQHGTSSGRFASRLPNFQNLPREDERIKQCIISRPGKSFVSADFSQLEPRVFAYYSKDSRLMSAFDGTSDFYSVVGREVYSKHDSLPHKDGSPDAFGIKYKKLRDLSKVIALASAYGATPFQLAPTTGKSIDETQKDMDAYFERFPGVQIMMLEAHELANKDGQVTNLFGRPRRIPDAKNIKKIYGNVPHAELPYEARKLLNMACNHRIQSTGASIVNRAMIKVLETVRALKIDCKVVSQVHDEIILECGEKDADTVSLLLQDAMENTVKLEGVALEAIPRISKTFAKA
jgi:DNA polymerase-1